MEFIKQTISELLDFIKNPIDEAHSNQQTSFKLKQLQALFLLELPVMGVLLLFISGLEEVGLFDSNSHKAEALLKEFSTPIILLFTVLIAPVIEEFIFRFFLIFRRCYPVHFIVFIISVFSRKEKNELIESARRFWNTTYKSVIYFSAFLFGLVHLTNFEISSSILLLSPILIAPQIILGLFLTFIRVRHGFLWSFYLHGIHNLIFVGLALIFGDL